MDALRRRNIELVASLSPEDARFLSYLAERVQQHRLTPLGKIEPFKMTLDRFFPHHFKQAGFESELPIDSLLSLGVLRLDQTLKPMVGVGLRVSRSLGEMDGRISARDMTKLVELEKELVVTSLGMSLIDALFPSHPPKG